MLVRLDGAEGIVLRRDAGLGQRIEECRLADVGQADDAAFEAHGFPWEAGGAGRVLIFCVAAGYSPRASIGQASRARSNASSISERSSLRGFFRT